MYVYILTNKNNTTLDVGITNDIYRRANEHDDKVVDGFTKRYNLNKLVYVEETKRPSDAIAREKQIKHWRREKKDALINSMNPEWKDLLREE